MKLLPRSHNTERTADAARPVRRWRPADIVTLVVVVSYGAAALIVAAGLFVRLVSHG